MERGGEQSGPQYLRYAGGGFQFAGTFLVMGAIGWWLDGKLGTEPWLLLVGIFVGAAGGFYSLVLRVAPPGNSRKSQPNQSSEPPSTPPE